MEGCRKASEKYWQNQEKKKVVINLIAADDLHDLNNEQIDINFEDLDQKIELSDQIFFHQLYVPTMAIRDDNEPITHNFLKTFFRLEKANALIPNTNETTPVLVLFDCRSGKTVGN